MRVIMKSIAMKQHIVKGSIKGERLVRLIEKANSGKLEVIRGQNRNGNF